VQATKIKITYNYYYVFCFYFAFFATFAQHLGILDAQGRFYGSGARRSQQTKKIQNRSNIIFNIIIIFIIIFF